LNERSGFRTLRASIGCSSWAHGIFDRCWRSTSSTTTASDPIAGSILLHRREPKTSRRYASTTRSDVVTSWVACFTSTTEELRKPLRSRRPPTSIKSSEILEIGIGRAAGKVGLLGCSGVVLCTTIVTMRSRTQDTNSEVAPYRCKCGARGSQTRHERPISAPRTAATWTFSGADDGIRTRDPHLGKKKRTGEPQLPTCTFAN
jgi:hypothetical protein